MNEPLRGVALRERIAHLRSQQGLKVDAGSVPLVKAKPSDHFNKQQVQGRWSEAHLPLVVSFQMPEDSTLCKAARWQFQEALTQWEVASKGSLRFSRSPFQPGHLNPEQFNGIVITWASQATPGRPNEVGHTLNQMNDQGEIIHSHIELLTAPLIDRHLSSTQQAERLQATFLHELGHALGLEHSNNSKAVMHYQGWKNVMLHHSDIHHLRLLYPEKG